MLDSFVVNNFRTKKSPFKIVWLAKHVYVYISYYLLDLTTFILMR